MCAEVTLQPPALRCGRIAPEPVSALYRSGHKHSIPQQPSRDRPRVIGATARRSAHCASGPAGRRRPWICSRGHLDIADGERAIRRPRDHLNRFVLSVRIIGQHPVRDPVQILLGLCGEFLVRDPVVEGVPPFNPVLDGFPGLRDWRLLSNASYGEHPNGTWTVHVAEFAAADTGSLTGARLRVYYGEHS